jgi:hypothetical protein
MIFKRDNYADDTIWDIFRLLYGIALLPFTVVIEMIKDKEEEKRVKRRMEEKR